MIKKIAHIADIHIRRNPSRNEEYEGVFNNLYKSLREQKPDRICLVGDIVENYINMQGEQLVLTSNFFNELSKIAPVVVIRGNHDYEVKNKKRIDTIEAILTVIDNPNITYYNETNFYDDENITWAVWKHGDKKISPWKMRSKNYNKDNVVIDLFHNTVNGATNEHGFEFKSNNNIGLKDLKGDYSFLGHIHKQQFLDKDNKKAYSSSLVAQNFSEGDDSFHGYIMWNIEEKTHELISIENDYSFKSVEINDFTDFEDVDIEIDNPTKYMRIRFIWNTLPFTKSAENEKKIESYIKGRYDGVLTINHKEEFIEDKEVDKLDDDILMNINNNEVQQTIFRDYLGKLGVDEDVIDEIVDLDNVISERIDLSEFTNNKWDIIKFGGTNFMSYEQFDIDWSDANGIHQILGKNTGGKTTLFKTILYTLYNMTPETRNRVKFGDSRYVNNRNGATFTETYLILSSNSEYYGIKRRTDLKRNRAGEINGAPTKVSYYKLASPDDELTEENSLENLNEENRIQTQKNIDRIIGDYDNFLRVVFTTSDTLNVVLSNDMAEFIDSLLYDSGLDIFDRKLNEFKNYQKEINDNIPKISCDVEYNENLILKNEETVEEYKQQTKEVEKTIDNIKIEIANQNKLLNENQGNLYEIDEDLYQLNIEDIKKDIERNNIKKGELNENAEREKTKLIGLAENFDEEEYNRLNIKIDEFKTKVFNIRNNINQKQSEINNLEYNIQRFNGDIHKLTVDGEKKKARYVELKNAPKCTKCGQSIVGDEHKDTLNDILNELKDEMFKLADEIKTIREVSIKGEEEKIVNLRKLIGEYEAEIVKINLENDTILLKLGELTNARNDVIKRNEINSTLEKIPLQIEIIDNKIRESNNLIERYNNNLKMIESNKNLKEIINKIMLEINNKNESLVNETKRTVEIKNSIDLLVNRNKELRENINDYKKQERRELIEAYYGKCIHRNGIPRQMLSNYIVPQINIELSSLLEDVAFNVWLDEEDLRPKLTYKNNANSTIDAISSSGKERTFASLALKMGLISINKKSKPGLFLLDEVTGKLIDESVDEFIELLNAIKKRVNKIIIVEHTHDVEPDYLMEVTKTDEGISSVTFN